MDYQPTQYSGIVPQLQVPDFVRPFEESQQRIRQAEQQEVADLSRDQKTALQNLKSSFVDTTDQMESLAKLSKTLAAQVDKTRIQERQNKYDDKFFETLNKDREARAEDAKWQAAEEKRLKDEGKLTAEEIKKIVSKQPNLSGLGSPIWARPSLPCRATRFRPSCARSGILYPGYANVLGWRHLITLLPG